MSAIVILVYFLPVFLYVSFYIGDELSYIGELVISYGQFRLLPIPLKL